MLAVIIGMAVVGVVKPLVISQENENE
jgi:hypothetical protein